MINTSWFFFLKKGPELDFGKRMVNPCLVKRVEKNWEKVGSLGKIEREDEDEMRELFQEARGRVGPKEDWVEIKSKGMGDKSKEVAERKKKEKRVIPRTGGWKVQKGSRYCSGTGPAMIKFCGMSLPKKRKKREKNEGRGGKAVTVSVVSIHFNESRKRKRCENREVGKESGGKRVRSRGKGEAGVIDSEPPPQ